MMIVLVVVIGVRGGLRPASQTSLDDGAVQHAARSRRGPCDGAAAQLSQLSGDQAAARLLRSAGCISLRHAGHPTCIRSRAFGDQPQLTESQLELAERWIRRFDTEKQARGLNGSSVCPPGPLVVVMR